MGQSSKHWIPCSHAAVVARGLRTSCVCGAGDAWVDLKAGVLHGSNGKEIQRGDTIVTNGGLVGKVTKTTDEELMVDLGEGTKVKVMAMVTQRVGEGVAFMPFHFGGHFEGEDLRSKYPDGADPIVLGESTNTAQTYGYDSVTQMQETKATLCKIMPA